MEVYNILKTGKVEYNLYRVYEHEYEVKMVNTHVNDLDGTCTESSSSVGAVINDSYDKIVVILYKLIFAWKNLILKNIIESLGYKGFICNGNLILNPISLYKIKDIKTLTNI